MFSPLIPRLSTITRAASTLPRAVSFSGPRFSINSWGFGLEAWLFLVDIKDESVEVLFRLCWPVQYKYNNSHQTECKRICDTKWKCCRSKLPVSTKPQQEPECKQYFTLYVFTSLNGKNNLNGPSDSNKKKTGNKKEGNVINLGHWSAHPALKFNVLSTAGSKLSTPET